MTKNDQIKILNNKIKANNAQYDINRLNAKISAYSSGDLDKYEFLTKQDLKYKPDALEQAKFAYSPLGKVFNDGLNKKDKTKKVGILQRLKNIEDNLNNNDDDDNGNGKVGIFQIIKDIKDKGIKISNDDEAIREIREHIQNLRNEGIRVNNFDEISREIKDHIQNLKDKGIDVNINNDQVNDLVDKIFKGIGKKDSTPQDSTPQDSTPQDSTPQDLTPKNLEIKSFLLKYKEPIETFYSSDIFGKHKIDTKEINSTLANHANKTITEDKFLQIYNVFINKSDRFSEVINKKALGARGLNQKNLLDYGNELKKAIEKYFNPSRSGLKILTPQQMFTHLPILLAQVQAGNNSQKLKNEIRQLSYSLYKSKKISKTVYKNLIATI